MQAIRAELKVHAVDNIRLTQSPLLWHVSFCYCSTFSNSRHLHYITCCKDIKATNVSDVPQDPVRVCVVAGKIPVEFRLLLVAKMYKAGLVHPSQIANLKRQVAEDGKARAAAQAREDEEKKQLVKADRQAEVTAIAASAFTSVGTASVGASTKASNSAAMSPTTTNHNDVMANDKTSKTSPLAVTASDPAGSDYALVEAAKESVDPTLFTSKKLFAAAWDNRVDEVGNIPMSSLLLTLLEILCPSRH